MPSLTTGQQHLLLGLLFAALGAVTLYLLWSDFQKGVTKPPRAFAPPIDRRENPVAFRLSMLFQLAVYAFLFWIGLSQILIACGVAPVLPLISAPF